MKQYSVCRKNLKVYEERLHQRSYSSSQKHKSMSRCHNKDIKILLALLIILKMFLSVAINSEVMEAATRNCSFKRFLSKILKNSRENTSTGVSFLKYRTKREKKEFLAQVFFRELRQFFSEPFFWRLTMDDGCFWRQYPDYPIKIS